MASIGRQAPSIVLVQCKTRLNQAINTFSSTTALSPRSFYAGRISTISFKGIGIQSTSFQGGFGFYRQVSAVPISSTDHQKRSRETLADLLEVGGVKISRDDVVKENDPTNNVPDSVFSKIGLQLHRRENHPLGILKNEIYNYFENNFPGLFRTFDDLCPRNLTDILRNYAQRSHRFPK